MAAFLQTTDYTNDSGWRREGRKNEEIRTCICFSVVVNYNSRLHTSAFEVGNGKRTLARLKALETEYAKRDFCN
jgi:hypothetical protein